MGGWGDGEMGRAWWRDWKEEGEMGRGRGDGA